MFPPDSPHMGGDTIQTNVYTEIVKLHFEDYSG